MVIKYSTRAYIDKRSGQVMLRVRWCNKQYEVGFVTGVYAQEEKWDTDLQKAKKSTTHEVRGKKYTASQINEAIAELKEAVKFCFEECVKQEVVPTSEQLKELVRKETSAFDQVETAAVQVRKTMVELYNEFLNTRGFEKNWNRKAIEKYNQAFAHIMTANPGLVPEHISLQTMYNLRAWYVNNGYKNRTINKQTIMIKAFLKWIDQQDGYSVPDAVLTFSTNLKVVPKTVTHLKYKELKAFYDYEFKEDRLALARDLWCFMAFTSLRFSDLNALRQAHILEGNRIEMFTQKTDTHITIPLTNDAIALIEKYKDRVKNGRVFPSLSNQKLNDYVKEAAREVGINREVVEVSFVGTERHDEVHKMCDIISCHDARRTFVTCSLAMNIPAEVVMRCTGHSDYRTMKPYIETAIETQTLEMEKWNQSQFKSQIISALDGATTDDLKAILAAVNRVRQQA